MKTKIRGRHTLRTKIIVLTIIICVCTILIHGAIIIGVSIYSFSEKSRNDIELILNVISDRFDNKILMLEDIITNIRNNSEVVSFCMDADYDEVLAITQFENSTNIYSENNLVDYSSPFLQKIYLFNTLGENMSSWFYPSTISEQMLTTNEYRLLYQKAVRGNHEVTYQITENTLNIVFILYSSNMEKMGYCITVIDISSVKALFKDLDKYEGAGWAVYNDMGEILISSEEGPPQINELVLSGTYKVKQVELAGKKYLAEASDMGFGLKCAVSIPYREIFISILPTLQLFVLLLLGLLPVIAAILFFVVYKMTVPLKTVTQKIKMVGKGDFETKLPDFNTVELMEISSAFNEMTSKIHYLITQVYESNLLAKESQIKYLQSQMQPHFLFNVLSVVGMKAQMSGNEEIYKMIYSLSKLIQGKIFRNDELLIPLSEELALVKFYLYLQSQRFEDKLSYQVDLEEPLLMSVKIPRLCIEPIVENAVIHGLEPKEEAGHVSVRVYLQGNNLRIDVEDNGVGFVKDGASDWEPIEATSSSEHTQMGIKNTQRLINNLYGEEYGLTVRSEVGIGTVVSILLPLIKESKQNVESNDRR